MRRRGADPPAVEAVAGQVQRLAVLLTAGVPPPSAWRYLAEQEADPVIAAAARAAATGDDLSGVLRETAPAPTREAWAAVEAAWTVAVDVGAPLAGSLRMIAGALREVGRLQRDARIALAGPRATAQLVTLLPVVAVGFGALLGFDTIRVLFATGPGLACLAMGALLLLAGRRWSAALVRRASRHPAVPGLALDLAAIALSGGASIDRARALIARAAAGAESGIERVDAVLQLSQRAGVPAAELLLAEAEQLRLEARDAGQQRAARLGVSLMIPLGVCVLPAFMLLGVAPMLISVVSSTTLLG